MIRSVLIFLAVTNAYLYVKLRLGFFGGGVLRNAVYLLWAAVWAALPFASRMGMLGNGRVSEVMFALSFTWVAIVGMACVGFFFMDMLSLTARLSDLIFKTALRRFFAPRKCVPVTLCLIALAVLYSFYEAWNVRRVDLSFYTDKLPEGTERLRIVHVTDVHLGGVYTPARLEKVMDAVRSAEPDILVMTGDLVDGDTGFRAREAELLSSHGAKYGAFAVTGNHDFYSGIAEALAFMRKAGFTVLRGQRADAAGISIIGFDDSRYSPAPLSKIAFPEERFVLLLKHRPQIIEGTEGKFDLQLSGHTHGGQIWPFGYVAQRVNGHAQHLSYHGASAVYVSNGAGFWGPPLRFLTPPEVTVIDLVKRN